MINRSEGSSFCLNKALKENCWNNQTNNLGGFNLTFNSLWREFDEFLFLLSICVVCFCVSIGMCEDTVCICALHFLFFFSGEPRIEEMELTQVFHPFPYSFSLQHWRSLFSSLSPSAWLCYASHNISPFLEKCSHSNVYKIPFILLFFFQDYNLILAWIEKLCSQQFPQTFREAPYACALLHSDVPRTSLWPPPFPCSRWVDDESSGCSVVSLFLL